MHINIGHFFLKKSKKFLRKKLLKRLNIHTIITIILLSVCILYTPHCLPLVFSDRDVGNILQMPICNASNKFLLKLKVFNLNYSVFLKVFSHQQPNFMRFHVLATYFVSTNFIQIVWRTDTKNCLYSIANRKYSLENSGYF